MTEHRIDELETRYAYSEETLRVLSDVVARQQQQIDTLEQACRELAERIANGQRNSSSGAVRGSLIDEVPPHY